MITLGIDLGTQRVKVVVLKDGAVVSRGQAFSGFDATKAAEEAVAEALKDANLTRKDIAYSVVTGSSMENAPQADSLHKHDGRRRQSRSLPVPESPNHN